ncbi:MAG TPA: hypothetical protein VM621_17465 [Luteibacter sp.]|uniref:hypothetical protein n=1 Tax=Luteibacter sp. TaxID=1886636 RepID=UPI002C7CC27F|nr:hypothetical protein [Luteibacter sp.]HVI56833.1 hypothetical protein [Luteibacter sp.]
MTTHRSAAAILMTFALAPTGALASNSIGLQVAGSISPTSCEVSLRDGVLDLGDIGMGDLNPIETEYTHFVDKDNTLLVECGGPARFALKARDLATGGGNGRERYGLGLGSNGKPTGHFVLTEQYHGAMADAKAAYVTGSEDLASWSASTDSSIPFSQGAYYVGLNKTGGVTSGPDFIRSASMSLSIAVYIAPKVDLVLEDELTLAGDVSFEIAYF